jgi:ribosomal protein L16/L10AE
VLFPKNIKYKKVHRHKNKNLKKGYSNFLNFAFFAIKALENMRLSSKLLNIILFKIQNVGKQIGKALVFPNKSATRKKEKARMGKGVGVFFR